MRTYDCIIIGTGAAGTQAAYKFAERGKKVAVIENWTPGGTCPQRGCDPKKILLSASEAKASVERILGYGLKGLVSVDWRQLMERKNEYTQPVPEQTTEKLKANGIDLLSASPRFLSPQVIEVDGEQLTADRFLIATGLRPRPLDIPGSERMITSHEFLDLKELPRRLVCIGGGYISFEFAHLARIAGADVTMLIRSKALKQFDEELVGVLVEATRSLGIDVRFEVEPVRYEGNELTLSTGDVLLADAVLNATGRVPSVDGLDLEKAGVEMGTRGIRVNEYLQTSADHIYAAGDVAESGNPALTPFSGTEGRLAADNMLEGNKRERELIPVPSLVFTSPNLAKLGKSEEELKKEGIPYSGKFLDTSDWQENKRVKDQWSRAKILTGENEEILGAHFLGVNAAELANHFAFAMQHRIPRSAMKQTSFAYPTPASDIAMLLEQSE